MNDYTEDVSVEAKYTRSNRIINNFNDRIINQ